MNYNSAGAAGTGGMLAVTGAGDLMWVLLAGFALIAAGGALLRVMPRREAEQS